MGASIKRKQARQRKFVSIEGLTSQGSVHESLPTDNGTERPLAKTSEPEATTKSEADARPAQFNKQRFIVFIGMLPSLQWVVPCSMPCQVICPSQLRMPRSGNTSPQYTLSRYVTDWIDKPANPKDLPF